MSIKIISDEMMKLIERKTGMTAEEIEELDLDDYFPNQSIDTGQAYMCRGNVSSILAQRAAPSPPCERLLSRQVFVP
ncbi:MAG: phage tail assembly protein [bacterium]